VAHTGDSITFSLVGPDGMEGFPGVFVSYITYTLSNMAWNMKTVVLATTKKTPIILDLHVRDFSHGVQYKMSDSNIK